MLKDIHLSFMTALAAILGLFLLQEACFSQARPLTLTSSTLFTRAGPSKETRRIDGHSYDVVRLPESQQGTKSTVYQIIEGFGEHKYPAILKVMKKLKAGPDPVKEIAYLEDHKMLLFSGKSEEEGEEDLDVAVVRDVRKDFPNKGSPDLKPYPEWCEEEPSLTKEAELKQFWKLVEEGLTDEANKGYLIEDVDFTNLYCDKNREIVINIDGGPSYENSRGREVAGVTKVDKNSAAGKKEIAQYIQETIPELIEALSEEELKDAIEDLKASDS